ncbi:MAG: phosphate ABC transporter ATP-binding protein [Acidobacteriota bacterium]|nr:phosphate ABC transporter ATP-binding protein [Acidobacteriota bacterium]MDE3264555.1 phosphate ABC transporter ATP-binding protein [Acidobacteriota bacterium]
MTEASSAAGFTPAAADASAAILIEKLNLWYGDFQALLDVDLRVRAGAITSLIGPSGCGKTTLLRSVNRINERLGYVRTTGSIRLWGLDVLDPSVEVAQLRKQVGMVFQRPNPLLLSVRDNVLFGTRVHLPDGRPPNRVEGDRIVEEALRQVLLWDELKDSLDRRGTELSLEQQQKLCIARLLPVKPRLLLMDEPCSALDPAGTEAVEELIWKLRGDYTILIVTHNMAQARRASEECVFMLLGEIIEHSDTASMFLNPANDQTAAYIEGRYG